MKIGNITVVENFCKATNDIHHSGVSEMKRISISETARLPTLSQIATLRLLTSRDETFNCDKKPSFIYIHVTIERHNEQRKPYSKFNNQI